MTILHARANQLEIDLAAIDHNVRFARDLAGPDIAIVASVKANAYGHGIVPVSERLVDANVDVLATGSIADAIALRNADIDAPILLMGGALPAAVPELLDLNLIPTVHNSELADAVTAAAKRQQAVYIKVDCGFGRLGVPLSQAHDFVMQFACRQQIQVAGLYTHLPFFDADGCAWAREGLAQFDELVARLERSGLQIPITQSRASAALLAGLEDHCSAISPGALLYGLSPVAIEVADGSGLRPVLSKITTHLIQVSRDGGQPLLGVVPFGRVDGQRAPLPSSGAHALVNGIRAPVLKISLEHTVLDLSAIESAEVGDSVTLLGQDGDHAITLDDMATWQGVGNNDVLMSLNGNLPVRSIQSAL